MAVISFKQIKDIAKKNNETHILDLKYIDTRLEGIKIPIKIKSLEETMRLKNEVSLDKEKLTIEYKPYSRLPKALREIILKDDNFRNVSQNTYVQLVKLDEDASKIERMKYRERLFSLIIHIDMDYRNEEGKTMWEDAGIPKGDYNQLVDLFSDIIQYEAHLELFEVIIDTLRNGNDSDEFLTQAINFYMLRKRMEELTPEERKEVIDSIINTQKTLGEITEQVDKKLEEKHDTEIKEKEQSKGKKEEK